MNKNQLLTNIVIPTNTAHLELQTPISTQQSLYPETAYITYYEPREVAPSKSFSLIGMMQNFLGKFTSEDDDAEMATE